MKKKVEIVSLYTLLVLSSIFLFLLILSDFGLIFPSDNTFARVMQHLTAIILIIFSAVQLYSKKGK
jgi:uncharacterized membrane protein